MTPAFDFDKESYYHQVLDTLNSANLSEENLYIAKANTIMTFLNSEAIENDTSVIVQLTRTNQKLLKLAATADWNLNYAYKNFSEENHFSIPYPATYEAMKYFYSYYYFREIANYYHPSYKDKTDLVIRLKKHYQSISEKLGYEVIPMEGYINSWAYGMTHFQRDDLAIDMFDYNIELYPNHASVYNAKGFFLINQGREKAAISLFENSLELEEDTRIREVLERIN